LGTTDSRAKVPLFGRQFFEIMPTQVRKSSIVCSATVLRPSANEVLAIASTSVNTVCMYILMVDRSTKRRCGLAILRMAYIHRHGRRQ
jgi:hypothetical protein